MELKGSKTLVCLMKAFAGESQARQRYTMYSKIAQKEGYLQISRIFAETAHNEERHAKIFFQHMQKGLAGEQFPYPVNITADYPVGVGTTVENLRYAAAGEDEENEVLYPEFAATAQSEGFKAIAHSFRQIGEIEAHHRNRYQRLASLVENGEVFEKVEPVAWICDECGHIHYGTKAPKICGVCQHEQGHFSILSENY
ncbi:MAG: rubrerythrin [Culicoidibacterales bacterium]